MAHHAPQHPPPPRLSFVVKEVDLPRGHRELIRFDHTSLVNQLVGARDYAASHGGDLPRTALLDAAARIYKEDPQLFSRLHQCPALLRLLRGDLAHDGQLLPGTVPQVPPAECGAPAVRPIVCASPPEQQINAVPEPASAALLVAGLFLSLVAGRMGRRG